MSCENGDPPNNYESGGPGPYFHNIILETPRSQFSQEIWDHLMKIGTPSAIHYLRGVARIFIRGLGAQLENEVVVVVVRGDVLHGQLLGGGGWCGRRM